MDINEQKPLDTPEALEEWLRENRDCDSQWKYYLAGVAHGENAQHEKSYALGYKDGWRDGRHPLNAALGQAKADIVRLREAPLSLERSIADAAIERIDASLSMANKADMPSGNP